MVIGILELIDLRVGDLLVACSDERRIDRIILGRVLFRVLLHHFGHGLFHLTPGDARRDAAEVTLDISDLILRIDIAIALRGTGLACNRNREAAERACQRTALGNQPHALQHMLQIAFRNIDLRCFLFFALSFALDTLDDGDLILFAAVAQGSHIACHLQRGIGVVALSDRDVEFITVGPFCLLKIGIFADIGQSLDL